MSYGKALSTYKRINNIKRSSENLAEAGVMITKQNMEAMDAAKNIARKRNLFSAIGQGITEGVSTAMAVSGKVDPKTANAISAGLGGAMSLGASALSPVSTDVLAGLSASQRSGMIDSTAPTFMGDAVHGYAHSQQMNDLMFQQGLSNFKKMAASGEIDTGGLSFDQMSQFADQVEWKKGVGYDFESLPNITNKNLLEMRRRSGHIPDAPARVKTPATAPDNFSSVDVNINADSFQSDFSTMLSNYSENVSTPSKPVTPVNQPINNVIDDVDINYSGYDFSDRLNKPVPTKPLTPANIPIDNILDEVVSELGESVDFSDRLINKAPEKPRTENIKPESIVLENDIDLSSFDNSFDISKIIDSDNRNFRSLGERKINEDFGHVVNPNVTQTADSIGSVGRNNPGILFDAEIGEEIQSEFSGEFLRQVDMPAYGNVLIFRGDDGNLFAYGGLSGRFRRGQRISKGDVVGKFSGNISNSLFFGVRNSDDGWLDPKKFLGI